MRISYHNIDIQYSTNKTQNHHNQHDDFRWEYSRNVVLTIFASIHKTESFVGTTKAQDIGQDLIETE
jgi:hypothetical protein